MPWIARSVRVQASKMLRSDAPIRALTARSLPSDDASLITNA